MAGSTSTPRPRRRLATNWCSPVRDVDRGVRNTRDTLILEGWRHGLDDAQCCPNERVRFALRFDGDHGWTTRWLRVIP